MKTYYWRPDWSSSLRIPSGVLLCLVDGEVTIPKDIGWYITLHMQSGMIEMPLFKTNNTTDKKSAPSPQNALPYLS